jgi:hypothetical protein
MTLASQTAGLFRPGVTTARECEYVCEVGDLFDLDGGFWEVKSVDGDAVMYGDVVEEDWEVGETDDISSLIDTNERTLEKEDEVEYSPDPDVRRSEYLDER